MPDLDPSLTLKPIRADAIPKALLKAERYRLLKEPREAESICRDILAADPQNQAAVMTLTLALTDQFAEVAAGVAGGSGMGSAASPEAAQALLPRLAEAYDRAYMEGVILERWGKAQRRAGTPGHVVYDWIRQAMDCFQTAERLSPPGNDDAVLRWNACVRLLREDPSIRPSPKDAVLEETGAFDDIAPTDWR